jgi:hypothetical protein
MGIAAGPGFSDLDKAPAERLARRPVRMRGFLIMGDKTHHEVHLLDLSYEGCGIETAAPLEPGQAVKLSILQRGAIDAVVRWCRGGKAGLAFVPDAAPPKKRWPRRSERVALSAEVTLRRLGHASFSVAVTDASPNGCKVELVERPAEGEHVLVKFDGLEPLESVVCWVEGFTAGLKFARPMHPAVFDLMIERLGQPR